MHRAVLLAHGPTIGPDAIMLTSQLLAPGGSAAPQPQPQPMPVHHYPAPTLPGGYGRAAQHQPIPLSPHGGGGTSGTSGLVGRTVSDVERDLIIDTLSHTLGNRTHAANILGISIRTLRNKLKQYGDEGFAVPPAGEGERAGA